VEVNRLGIPLKGTAFVNRGKRQQSALPIHATSEFGRLAGDETERNPRRLFMGNEEQKSIETEAR